MMSFPRSSKRLLDMSRAPEQPEYRSENLGLSERQVEQLIELEKEQRGDFYVDLAPTLREAVTVARLRTVLKGEDPRLPVKINIVTSVDEDGSCTLDDYYAVDAYSLYGTDIEQYLVVEAVKPECLERWKASQEEADKEEEPKAPTQLRPRPRK